MTFKTYDDDTNGVLDGSEFTNWRGFTKKMILEMNRRPSEGMHKNQRDQQYIGYMINP